MNITPVNKTVAQLAREVKTKVNLGELAKGRKMRVASIRAIDGSTIKLLNNANEVDCIIMQKGKVLSAKGTFCKSPQEASDLTDKAIFRIANYAAEPRPGYPITDGASFGYYF